MEKIVTMILGVLLVGTTLVVAVPQNIQNVKEEQQNQSGNDISQRGTICLMGVPYIPVPGFDPCISHDEWNYYWYHTYDLVVNVDAGDQLIRVYADARIDNGEFWEHCEGGNTQPNPDLFQYFPFLRYDSFWTCTEEYPNPDVDPSNDATTFAPGSPLVITDTQREAEWFADPAEPNVDGGTYALAQYTARNFFVGYGTLTVEGWVLFNNSEMPVNFSLEVPVPLLGDLDRDYDVDLQDLAILLSNYGMASGATYKDGDLDFDGDVDLSDLAELLGHYGEEL